MEQKAVGWWRTKAPREALVVLALNIPLLAGCSRQEKLQPVRLWALAPPEVTADGTEEPPPLRFAVALNISPQEGYQAYGDLAEALGRKMDHPVRLVLRKTFSEVNDLVRNRRADVALLCARGFHQGHADFGLTALAIPVVNARKSHSSYFLVSAESEFNTSGDLAGKTWAFADPVCAPEPISGKREDRRPYGFTGHKPTITGHDRAIHAVAEGLVNGALVDGLVHARMLRTDPDLIAKTKIVGRTGSYVNSPIAVHPGLDPTLKKRLKNALLTLHQEEPGWSALTRLGFDRFIAADPVEKLQ